MPVARPLPSAFRCLPLRIGFAALSVLTLGAGVARSSEVIWRSNIAASIRESAGSQKPLLIVFESRTCMPCRKLLQETFHDGTLAARVNEAFIPLLVDADAQAAFAQSVNIEALPTILVVNSDRKIAGRLTGYQPAAELDRRLAAFVPAQASPVRPAVPMGFLQRHSLNGQRSQVTPQPPSPGL